LDKYWRETVTRAVGVPDTLLLACTHYPLLYPAIRALVPAATNILVQGDLVAPALTDYLARHPEIARRLTGASSTSGSPGGLGSERFLTTDQTENFAKLASLFLGRPVDAE